LRTVCGTKGCVKRFITPCLPIKTDKLPSGSPRLHHIKHDGFRIIARKAGSWVRL